MTAAVPNRRMQDSELIILDAPTIEALRDKLSALRGRQESVSRAELADLAAWSIQHGGGHDFRAAMVVSSPAELETALKQLEKTVNSDWDGTPVQPLPTVVAGRARASPRIVAVFPGQGAPLNLEGGAWQRRFPELSWYGEAVGNAYRSTAVRQPAIVAASINGLIIAERLGLSFDAAIGHSLGDLVALRWSGALENADLARLATVRGRRMAEAGLSGCMMVVVGGPADQVESLLAEQDGVWLAGVNTPQESLVSGRKEAVMGVTGRAADRGWRIVPVKMAGAFHSPLMKEAAGSFADDLKTFPFGELKRPVFSSITGAQLGAEDDLSVLLQRQLTEPVRFHEAVMACGAADLVVEMGPGRGLTRLMKNNFPVAVAMDVGGRSLKGLLTALGTAYVVGKHVELDRLFKDRFTRPFSLIAPSFLSSSCETVGSIRDSV